MSAPRIYRQLAFTLLVTLVVLCGCAHQYLLNLRNGDQILSTSKPNPQGANYHFTGRDGVGAYNSSDPRG